MTELLALKTEPDGMLFYIHLHFEMYFEMLNH